MISHANTLREYEYTTTNRLVPPPRNRRAKLLVTRADNNSTIGYEQ